jgi:hypothetical protein
MINAWFVEPALHSDSEGVCGGATVFFRATQMVNGCQSTTGQRQSQTHRQRETDDCG